MLSPMRTSNRIPLAVYAGCAALAAVAGPFLAMAAWTHLVWQTPGTPDAVASMGRLTAVAAALCLLVAGQLVLLVRRRREVADAIAAADAVRLEAAARRTLQVARLAAAAGALTLLAYLGVSVAVAARPGVDRPSFALALALLTSPALVALAAPAGFVRLAGPTRVEVARALRSVHAGTLVACVALGAVLLGASVGFGGAQAACQPGGGAALCGATNAAMGQVVGLVGPAVVLPCLATAERALRALWALGAA
jgi:hypothetical protein